MWFFSVILTTVGAEIMKYVVAPAAIVSMVVKYIHCRLIFQGFQCGLAWCLTYLGGVVVKGSIFFFRLPLCFSV